MANNIDPHLQRRLLAEVERQPDYHLAARTAINVAVLVALRSVGPGATACFLRDAADDLERHAIVEVLQ